MKSLTLCFLFALISLTSEAQLRLPQMFADHIVLQQQTDAPVWGWGNMGSEITITASWDKDIVVKTKTTNRAMWSAKLKTPSAGGPFVITIKEGNQTVVLRDVMIGEVWVCAGQSNMEWSVNNGAADAKEEMPKANFPQIRFFQVAKATADFPQNNLTGQWEACTPETMKNFSAVGYFFAKKLNADLKIPIGIINSSWGGTPAETWTPAEIVESDPVLKEASTHPGAAEWWPTTPGIIRNAMIAPLAPMAIAGVIWYQGESNVSAPASYKMLMQHMIESWRKDFNRDFPFYYVQIAPYTYGSAFQGALLREQQSAMLSIPKTGMVVVTDVVDDVANIHPKFKKPVGDRLANYALADTYKKPILGYQSPVYKSMTVDRNKIKLSFEYTQYGLISHNGEPTQFTIAGEDRKFYPATAKIDGGTVTVWAKEVKAPVAARFCFDNTTIPNLFNKENLPVSIFRTDSWEVK